MSPSVHDEASQTTGSSPPRVAASTRGEDGRYTRIPGAAECAFDPRAAYVHLTSNNTVFGTQWQDVVAFVLLVLLLLVRPTGILGESLGKARA